MNIRLRTAKPLEKNTFVLLTNQQQVDGVSKKLSPSKTGPYLIIDKPTETAYILKDENEENITIQRNHMVPYYPKEKLNKKSELKIISPLTRFQHQNSRKYLKEEKPITYNYNLRKRKIQLI